VFEISAFILTFFEVCGRFVAMKWAWQIFEVCGRFVDVKVGRSLWAFVGLWALESAWHICETNLHCVQGYGI